MSIPVALDELRSAVERYRFAYLLTVSADGRSHAVAVQPGWSADGAALTIGDLGRRTSTNLSERPNVSLVWPPLDINEYSLIVDGDATVTDGEATFRPTNAVLHRPAPARADLPAGSCGSDCVPIGLADAAPAESHQH